MQGWDKGAVEAETQGIQGGACAEESPTEPVLTVGPVRHRSECFQHICPTAFLELNATLVYRSLFWVVGFIGDQFGLLLMNHMLSHTS